MYIYIYIYAYTCLNTLSEGATSSVGEVGLADNPAHSVDAAQRYFSIDGYAADFSVDDEFFFDVDAEFLFLLLPSSFLTSMPPNDISTHSVGEAGPTTIQHVPSMPPK